MNVSRLDVGIHNHLRGKYNKIFYLVTAISEVNQNSAQFFTVVETAKPNKQ